MRYYSPKPDDVRIKTWFAILPVTIDNETRWLERVYVEQKYLYDWTTGCRRWCNLTFLEKSSYDINN